MEPIDYQAISMAAKTQSKGNGAADNGKMQKGLAKLSRGALGTTAGTSIKS